VNTSALHGHNSGFALALTLLCRYRLAPTLALPRKQGRGSCMPTSTPSKLPGWETVGRSIERLGLTLLRLRGRARLGADEEIIR